LQNFLLTYIALIYVGFFTSWLNLSWAADHFVELITGATILAISLSVSLFTVSYRRGAVVLAESGTSGNVFYDFWMGRELNPRVGRIDLKEFCELYPGLMGWALLNLSFAHKQLRVDGNVRSPSPLSDPREMYHIKSSTSELSRLSAIITLRARSVLPVSRRHHRLPVMSLV
jgi:hypothetical protein